MDVTTVENSHSVATCSDDGTVHVWRVDTAMPPANASAAVARGTGLSVAGAVSIRTLKEDSGPVVNIAHFNGSVASVLVYSSVVGGVSMGGICGPPRINFDLASDRSWDFQQHLHWDLIDTGYLWAPLWASCVFGTFALQAVVAELCRTSSVTPLEKPFIGWLAAKPLVD
jgi:hypothetical protein